MGTTASKTKKAGPFRPKAWLIVVVVLVVVGLVGGGIYWSKHREKPVKAADAQATLQKLYDGKLQINNAATRPLLEDAYRGVSSKGDKLTLLHALATCDVANKRYKDAVQDLLTARDLGDASTRTLVTLADTYRDGLTDKSNALKYYRLGLESSKKDQKDGRDPYAESQITYLNEQIKTLEAAGVK